MGFQPNTDAVDLSVTNEYAACRDIDPLPNAVVLKFRD